MRHKAVVGLRLVVVGGGTTSVELRSELANRGILVDSESDLTKVTERTVVVGSFDGAADVVKWANAGRAFGVALVSPSVAVPAVAEKAGLHFFAQFAANGSKVGEVYASPKKLVDVLARRCAAPSASPKTETILGFGSLLSETSARMTFPDLENFRLVRVKGFRRVFAHAAAIFFQRGIANNETLEFASLSTEFVSDDYPGFIAAAFDVRQDDPKAWSAFLEREEEFDLLEVPYSLDDDDKEAGVGTMCGRSSDEAYIARWGQDKYDTLYKPVVRSIWDWAPDSGLRPCAVYLRHCVLAVTKAGPAALDSFLDDTFLVDRKTSLRRYLTENPQIMDSRPPPSLIGRYSG